MAEPIALLRSHHKQTPRNARHTPSSFSFIGRDAIEYLRKK
jgi:hypothetical protein